MNKKIIITIGIILGLTVIVGGFLVFQKTRNQGVINNQQKQKVEVAKNDENESKQETENQEEKNKTEIENIKTTPQLSPEEIEKLKKEKDLVWYEIPELGIKFLVTKDTKDDLRYVVSKFNNKSVGIYSQSEVDFLPHQSCFNEWGDNLCTIGFLSSVLKKDNDKAKKEHKSPLCLDSQVIKVINDDIICYAGPQSPVLLDDNYEKYIETIKNKKFGIYLNVIEQIKNN